MCSLFSLWNSVWGEYAGHRIITARLDMQFAPYGSWSTFLPVGNPQTFRREQAPALRYAVYLFARRDAPPGASGKGRLWHCVAVKGLQNPPYPPFRQGGLFAAMKA